MTGQPQGLRPACAGRRVSEPRCQHGHEMIPAEGLREGSPPPGSAPALRHAVPPSAPPPAPFAALVTGAPFPASSHAAIGSAEDREAPGRGLDGHRPFHRPTPGQADLTRRAGQIPGAQKVHRIAQLPCPLGTPGKRDASLRGPQREPVPQQGLGHLLRPNTRCRWASAAPDKNATSSRVSARPEVTQDGHPG